MSEANNFIAQIGSNYNPKSNVADSIWSEYERVIVQSLFTSFGLDALMINDQHGGDVDTIHNVRQMDSDPNMHYKSERNRQAYENRGEYDSAKCHNHSNFRKHKQEGKQKGTLRDEYTGGTIGFGSEFETKARAELDHVVSGKETHDDRGRCLAGISTEELANIDDNFAWTNKHLNASKKDLSVEAYIAKNPELDEATLQQMRATDKKARAARDRKVNQTYYLGWNFLSDTAIAAVDVGCRRGLTQALGLVFAEVWCSVRYEVTNRQQNAESFLEAVMSGLKKGFKKAKEKFGEIIEAGLKGSFSGILSSITTTLINIFATTAKRLVKLIREGWSYLIDATKILIFNPDNLSFHDRMREGAKIIATGASVVCGGLVAEYIGKLGVDALPFGLGETVTTFCSVAVSGLLSITFLRALDSSAAIEKMVKVIKKSFGSCAEDIEVAKLQAKLLEEYGLRYQAASQQFKQANDTYSPLVARIEQVWSIVKIMGVATGTGLSLAGEKLMAATLFLVTKLLGIAHPFGKKGYKGFMKDRNARMRFK